MKLYSNPVSPVFNFVTIGIPLKHSSIVFDYFRRGNIIIEASNQYFFESQFFSFEKCETKHLSGISLPSLTRTNTVPNMSSYFDKSWMVYGMSYLNRSENPLIFHEEKEMRIYTIRIGCYIFCDYCEKFLETLTRKKFPWTRRHFKTPPLRNHIQVGLFMWEIWEFELGHNY